MIKVLITGENSFIGNSVKDWLLKTPEKYSVKCINVKSNKWKDSDFSSFDVLLHVAGIVHDMHDNKDKSLFYEVNRDLTFEIAKKAKREGITQFIFMSTMSVYGMDTGIISRFTPLKPTTHYGKSKLQAENLLMSLAGEEFKLVILRPPMVYGKNCAGNYSRISKLVDRIPVFPDVSNERSVLYIDNLSIAIKNIIDEQLSGLFFPQNKDYMNTSELVESIASVRGQKMHMIKGFTWVLKKIPAHTTKKIFGNLVYEKKLSTNCGDNSMSLRETIQLTEKNK